MIKNLEGHFLSFDNSKIFYQLWLQENPKGTLIVTHGLAEHSDCYQEYAQKLNNAGYSVIGWDLRGHGKSEGKRGYVADFYDFIKDFDLFIKELEQKNLLNEPYAFWGHSLGGLISTRAIIELGSYNATLLALSAPAFGVAIEVPKFKETATKFASQWLPKITLFNEVYYKDLVHDQELIKRYEKDSLRHDKISPCLFLGMLESMNILKEKFKKIDIPILLQLAGQDKIVSTPAAEEVFTSNSIQKNKKIVYRDSFHEIFNDHEKESVYNDFIEYLNQGLK